MGHIVQIDLKFGRTPVEREIYFYNLIFPVFFTENKREHLCIKLKNSRTFQLALYWPSPPGTLNQGRPYPAVNQPFPPAVQYNK